MSSLHPPPVNNQGFRLVIRISRLQRYQAAGQFAGFEHFDTDRCLGAGVGPPMRFYCRGRCGDGFSGSGVHAQQPAIRITEKEHFFIHHGPLITQLLTIVKSRQNNFSVGHDQRWG